MLSLDWTVASKSKGWDLSDIAVLNGGFFTYKDLVLGHRGKESHRSFPSLHLDKRSSPSYLDS